MTYAIAQYLNVRQAFHPSFSSDGARLAFLTNITGDPQVWQIALNDLTAIPWPDQITFETDRVPGMGFSPAPSDARLIFARDAGGNENAQLFLLSANGVVTPSSKSISPAARRGKSPRASNRRATKPSPTRPMGSRCWSFTAPMIRACR